MKEVVQKAEEHVMNYEGTIINMLFRELDDSKARSEKCGCPNCKKHVEAIELLLSKELDRITPRQ